MKKNRVLSVFWITLLLIPLSLVLLNIMVDPYWYFDFFRIPFFSQYKPQFANEARMAKTQHICRQKPSNVILGGSRAELGLSTTHPGWKNYPGITYNLGFAGTGIWEMNKTLQHAYYGSGNLKLAVVNLDFLMFNRNLEDVVFDTVVVGFDQNRLLQSQDDSCTRILKYDLDKLLGYQALKNSYESIVKYLNIKPSTHVDYKRDGRMTFTFRKKEDIAQFNRKNTSKKDRVFSPDKSYLEQYGQEIAFVNKTWRAGPTLRYCFTKIDGSKSTFDDYRAMLKFAREHHIELKFIISPEHANMMVALQAAGLWVMFEDWKKQLVRINDEVAQEYHTTPYKIWDFSGFNKITTVLREDLLNKYYWEPSHYKELTGDKMLDVVLGDGAENHDFGTAITTNNIQEHLDNTLALGKIYEKNDFPLHLKDAIAGLFGEHDGSTCGFHNEMLYKGNETSDIELSRTYLSKALELYKNEEARYKARDVAYQESNFLKHYAQAVKGKFLHRPLDTWQEYQSRGTLALSSEDHVSAIDDYSEAIKRCPTNAALFFQRASVYMLDKEYNKAIEDYSEAIKQLPKNASLYFQRGSAYTALQRYHEAMADFAQGLKIDPNNEALAYLYKDATRLAKEYDSQHGQGLVAFN